MRNLASNREPDRNPSMISVVIAAKDQEYALAETLAALVPAAADA